MVVNKETGLSQPVILALILMIILGLGGAMIFFLLASEEPMDSMLESGLENRQETTVNAIAEGGDDATGDRVSLDAGLPEGWRSLSGKLTLDTNLLSNVIVQAVPDRVEPLPDSFKKMLEFSPAVIHDEESELKSLLQEIEQDKEDQVVESTSDSEGGFVLDVPESETLTFRLDHDFYYLPKEQGGPFFWDEDADAPELAEYDGRLEAKLGSLIVGEVLDSDGLPVGNALVMLEQEEGSQGMERMFFSMMGAGRMRLEATTDEQGLFSLRGAEPGEGLFVSAEFEGLVAAKSESFDASPGETVRIQVQLGQGSTIAAQVVDPEDTPLADAKVFLRKERDSDDSGGGMGGFMRAMAGPEIVEMKESDAEGRVLFTALGPGEYSVVASFPGMCEMPDETDTVVVRKKVRDHEVIVPLDWGETISGQVVDDTGAPVADARVAAQENFSREGRGMGFMMRGASSWATRAPREALSDAEGFFRITGLEPEASYDLVTEKAEFTPSIDEEIDAGRKDVTITLEKPGQIEGRVFARLSQAAVEEFRIRIVPAEAEDDRRRGREFRGSDRGRNDRGRNDRGRDRRGGFDRGRGMGRDMGRMIRRGAGSDNASSATSRLFDTLRDTMRSRFAGPERYTEREEDFRNSEGRFVLRDIIPGSYKLCVSANSFSPLISEPLQVEKGFTVRDISLLLGPGASVSGEVRGPLGVVSKVEVRIVADDKQVISEEVMDLLLDTVEETFTKSNGSFRIDSLPEGNYRLRAEHPDFPETRTDPFPLREGERLEGVVIDLPSGGTVIGTAIDINGAPLVATQVICSAERGRNRTRFTVTDSDGAFEVAGLREGTYRVRLLSRRSDMFSREEGPSSVTVTLAEGETQEVFLQQTEAEGVTVRGTITASGAPLESGFVTAMAIEGGAPAFATLNGDGTYALEQVRAGDNRFTVRFGNATDMDSVTLTYAIPDHDEVVLDIDLPDGRVQGRVVDGITGQALAGVNLNLAPESEPETFMRRRFGSGKRTVTDEGGYYSFRWLGPGDYRLRAEYGRTAETEGIDMNYYPVEVTPIKILENQSVDNLDIALYTGGGIDVEALQENGEPLDRATVIATLVEDDSAQAGVGGVSIGNHRERTDEEGRALVEPIEPGEYKLTVQARNMGQLVKEGIFVSAGAIERVSVTLAEGFSVSVRLSDSTGAPVNDAEIVLRDAQNRQLSLPPMRMSRGNTNRYSLGSLIPGAYTLEAAWQNKKGLATFNVTRSTDLQLTLR